MAEPMKVEGADYDALFEFMVNTGLACPVCDSKPEEVQGIEVGSAVATCVNGHTYAIKGDKDDRPEWLRGWDGGA